MTVIGNIHSLLAFTIRSTNGSVSIDNRFPEKGCRLLLPNLAAYRIYDLYQFGDLFCIESMKEITSSGRGENDRCAQCIQPGLIVSQ